MTTWLTLEEAAKHLKIGKSTIYRLAREGDLPAHRMGRVWRFDVDELDAWVKSIDAPEPRRQKNETKGNVLRRKKIGGE
ncbi:MAG: helix-turn-helix domain-containing protein [Candidatus Eisenbacteria bacterium]|nr:helix-turn-helix domain-containing protein [Candidatus Eisenbacteria bacterium]